MAQLNNVLNWGDGSPDTSYPANANFISYLYPDSGTYTITLTVTDTSGCIATDSFDVRIHFNPTAEILFSNVCDENPVNFQFNTFNGDGEITDWDFSYITGLISTGNLSQNIPSSLQYTYQQCGQWAISLFIEDSLTAPYGQGGTGNGPWGTDDNGAYCSSTLDTTITIYCPPVAVINSVDPYVCEGDTSFFENLTQQGSIPSAPFDASSWYWIFGGTGVGNNTDSIGYWIYDSCGAYDIVLVATDTNNCSDTSTINLVSTEVLCNTDASFIVDDSLFCGPDIVMAVANPSYWDYDWTVNPSPNNVYHPLNNSTLDTLFAEFNINPGPDSILYSIILETTQINGLCPDSDTVEIVVYPKPLVSFIPITSSGCGPWEITFNNTSDPNNGNENISSMNFQWLINDSIVSFSSILIYEFDNIDEDDTCYIVSLIGFTMHGCVDTFETQICINPDPIAEIELLANNDTINITICY